MSVFFILKRSIIFKRFMRCSLASIACVGLWACGSLDGASNRIVGIVTPYKVEVVQGNFVSKEQVEALRPGMARGQVREILGSPLVTSAFHADRWDYVFTIRRQGVEAQSRKLTVFFKGEELEKFEGDTMPSEAEFVAKLDNNRKLGKVPNLQASDEDLAKTQTKPQGNSPADTIPAVPALQQVYPPLEPTGR
jgi:outer membrane protein assembly factor BamE